MQSKARDDEVEKLESEVIYAMSRLQKKKKPSSQRGSRTTDVDSCQIVDYLSENGSPMDGDIESQVITALLSCVKNGIVCMLANGKYRLLGSRAKFVVSNCLTWSNHGSKCSCLEAIAAMTKVNPNACCWLRSVSRNVKPPFKKRLSAPNSIFSKPKLKPKLKKKSKPKVQIKVKPTKKPETKKEKKVCIQKFFRESGNANVNPEGDYRNRKCTFCLRYHEQMVRFCKRCFPQGVYSGIPINKFSLREEVM